MHQSQINMAFLTIYWVSIYDNSSFKCTESVRGRFAIWGFFSLRNYQREFNYYTKEEFRYIEVQSRKFYLRRNSNISAKADTGEHSVRCTVTSLIFK